jgi:hypothetical protein
MPKAKDNKKVIEAMTNQVTNLFASNASTILKALDSQIEVDEGSNKIVATIKMTVEREGDAHEFFPNIEYKAIVKHEDSLDKMKIDPNQPDLPGV